MKEKVLSLARGNFIYEAPGLLLTPEKLSFEVESGEKKTASFQIQNERGSVMRGFGATQEQALKFLPVFHAEKNKLSVEVNARDLMPGEILSGSLWLVTDCGEAELPYEIRVIPPVLADSKGAVQDYDALRRRIEGNPEEGAALFHHPKFQELFLFRDEPGKVLYHHLTERNTKMQSMEEFLVAMGKKDPIRLSVRHVSSDSTREVHYDLAGSDVRDALQIQVNTWGNVGIRFSAAADFIELDVQGARTGDFVNRTYSLGYTILGSKVREGKRYGSIVIESPYERKEIRICAQNTIGEQIRREARAKKKTYAALIRSFLAFREGVAEPEEYLKFLGEKGEMIEEFFAPYSLLVRGFIGVTLRDEYKVLGFYQAIENLSVPENGSDSSEVAYYILTQYVKYLSTKKQEDREQVVRLLDAYGERGYNGGLFFLLRLQVEERYSNLRRRVEDIHRQMEQGDRGTYLFSELMRAYRQDASLVTSLDTFTLTALQYGIKHGLMTAELAMAASFLAERMPYWNPLVFTVLERLYDEYRQTDTLRSLCGMLIRNERMDKKYFPWFERAVKERLRMTELYEYYMYSMNYAAAFTLPDSVISYFQYENHLNDRCKAFLYAYIIKKREEQPENFRLYGSHIREFALEQLARHRISEDIATIYEGLFLKENIQGPVARDLPFVMFYYHLACFDRRMESVVVVHAEMKEEVVCPLDNGQAMIQIYTPNYQIYFVDQEGHYLSGTVEYTLKKMLHFDGFAALCWENGSQHVHLLANLAVRAMRSARLNDGQAKILIRAMEVGCFREYTQGKLLLCLYDYYRENKDIDALQNVLDQISPHRIKREKIGEIATYCIRHGIYSGMYDKAAKMLARYGMQGCDRQALAVLVSQQIQERGGEFSPLLMKWAYSLYQERFFDRVILDYLLRYFMGRTSVLTAIYRKCRSQNMPIEDGSKERLLGQVLFTGTNPAGYEELFLDYYENGENRVLVKAFLSYYAYEYVVDLIPEIPEEMFSKIEKEAFYVRDRVMILAALKYFSRRSGFTEKEREFIERNLEECATDGLILAFMKEFTGKVTVPYEIENVILVQYNSGTEKAVFLHTEEGGKENVVPMKQVFNGIFTKEILLFCGEEKHCFIEEEESGRRTDGMVLKRPENEGGAPGFFQMVNQMIQAEKRNDREQYDMLRIQYEQRHAVAAALFAIEQ